MFVEKWKKTRLIGGQRIRKKQVRERKTMKKEPYFHTLTIIGTDTGTELFLDDTQLKCVNSFSLDADAQNEKQYASLSLKMFVNLRNDAEVKDSASSSKKPWLR